MVGRWLGLLLLLLAFEAHSEECAANLSELKNLPQFASVYSLFKDTHRISMVNETQGSYIVIEPHENDFALTFYTSGLFDFYGIKKDGPLVFCTAGEETTIRGLGRIDKIQIVDGKLILGNGGPKGTFQDGKMPALLMRLHGVNERAIASKP